MKAIETTSPSFVMEASDQDFEEIVLERSKQVPVLVDFWAPWCGPCKALGPTLEKLAARFAGRFMLVKVNMDENPTLAQVFQIRSIPAVKLFIGGQVRDEFMGAYPEPEILRFLEHNLPGETPQGATKGLELLRAGNTSQALELFKQALTDDPKDPVALMGMGLYHLEQGGLNEARQHIDRVNEVDLERLGGGGELQKLFSALKARLYLAENADMNGDTSAELSTAFRQGCRDALQGNFQQALDAFLGVVRKDRSFRDDGGRKAILAVLSMLPADSPLLQTYRFKLSNLLFS